MTYVMQNKWLYIFLAIGMIYLFIFNYLPMYGVVIAFQNFSPVKGFLKSEWVGLANFKYLFHSRDFIEVFKNSILISLYRIFWGFPAPIILALMLNEVKNLVFKRSIQTVVYLPHFISWVVLASMVVNFLAPSGGLVNNIIVALGGKPISFLTSTKWFRTVLVVTDIFKGVGWGTIVYLASMTSIDPGLYEAAIIDGATRMQRIKYITLPGISSTIVVLLVLRMGGILRNGFEQIFLLYSPLVYPVADVFETYTYRVGLLEGRFSYATAVGLFQSVVGFILIMLTNRISKIINGSSLW
ncbi:MAG TPA: protein lplB [Clostridiaceae bacterium]|nr:protein lplB [Clostridiaceae bacterium]